MRETGARFTVGERSKYSWISDLDLFHRRPLEGSVNATVVTYDSKRIARLPPMRGWGTDGTRGLLNTIKGRLKCRSLLDRGEVSDEKPPAYRRKPLSCNGAN